METWGDAGSLQRSILVQICVQVIDRSSLGNPNHPGLHKGSISPNRRPGPKPRLCPAQQETSSRCNPWRKVSVWDGVQCANQKQASLALTLLTACTMNPFSGSCGGASKGTRWVLEVQVCERVTTTTLDADLLFLLTESLSPRTWIKANASLPICHGNLKKKKVSHIPLEAHMCFIFKYIITSNLHSQITTCKAGRHTGKLLKSTIHKFLSQKTATKDQL